MASKVKTDFVCQGCGSRFPKWLGKCPGCGAWDTLVEERAEQADKRGLVLPSGKPPVPLSQVASEEYPRLHTGLEEFDRVMGGGMVGGSLSLLGGDPGIGKSTLLLQIASALAQKKQKVLYITAEESVSQVKLRAERLGVVSPNLLVYAENNFLDILRQIETLRPALAVVDSIQTVYLPDLPSAPGSVGQVRECAAQALKISKTLGVSVFLIGHVTKEGSIAGPRVLEHIVDTVLYFEGEKNHDFRILRVIKNRFGPANELSVFEMKHDGLAEILHPSSLFLSERAEKNVGSVVAAAREGTRPLLVEIQALVTRTSFGYPQRTCAGIDPKKLSLLCAVLERVADYPLGTCDIFLNVAGGLKVDEPGVDLAVALSIVSSLLNKPVDKKVCAVGEIGLSGRVRLVSDLEGRLKEAAKLGFTRMIVPAVAAKKIPAPPGSDVVDVADIGQAIGELFKSPASGSKAGE